MPNWMVMKNMQMFAEEVIPAFREPDGLPDYQRAAPGSERSHAELAAQEPAARGGRSLVTGGHDLIDHRLAHVAEVIDPTMANDVRERPASAG
jgi:hypothetical protein